MRIAIDTLYENPDRPTGSVDYLRSVVKAFPHLGPQHEYFALVSNKTAELFAGVRYPNLHFVQCFRSNENMPLRILIQQSVIPYLMEHHKVDVLYSPGNVCPLWGRFCRVLKINTLHQYHTPEIIGYARAKYRTLSFKLSAKRADHVVANTQRTKLDIHKFMRISKEKITVVGEAVDDIYEPVSAEQEAAVRRKYCLESDYILFVSVLYPYKNVETVIESLTHVPGSRTSGLKLVIAGRDCDGQQAKLEALARELGVRVQFLGFVPIEDLPSVYCGARVFVFPSLAETFGKPLVEAMRCGVPIVASNTSCIPEVLDGAGVLVNPLDAVEMASAIVRAAEDCALRKELIARGFRRGQDFLWESGARQTLEIIERTFDSWKISRLQGSKNTEGIRR